MKKRPDGRYQISVMIGYGPEGKPKRKLVYGRTQKEVKDKANKLRMQYNMGLEIDSDITVGEWADTWLKTYKAGVEYNTYVMYEQLVRNYVKKYLGGLRLKELKTAHLQKIINDNSDKGWIVKHFKMTVSQLLEQAVVNDLIIKNPAQGVKLPTTRKPHGKRALTEEEMEKILSLPLDARVKCYLCLLMYTGMRRCEVLALTRGDICRNKMEIRVNKTLIFKVNQSMVKPYPKTKAGERVVPILIPLKETLFCYLGTLGTDLLFPSREGGTMSVTGFRRMWEKFTKAMGTTEITFHIFRHNYATILYNAGVDIKAAQAILGHSNISVTMDIYTHLSDKNRSQAADTLNNYLTNI